MRGHVSRRWSRKRHELGKLVVLGKGLRRSSAFSAETGNEECRKQEAADLRVEPSRLWRVEGNGQELQHFLISRTELEALEVIRGAERESVLGHWRRLEALYDPLAAGRRLDDSRHILSPPRVTKIADFSHAIQAWDILEQRHRERTGDKLPKDLRLAILLSLCPVDFEKELTAQQHLFPDSAQLRAHIVTVVNSRTRGPAPIMMGSLSEKATNHDASRDEFIESEDGELYRLEIRNDKKVFTKPRHDSIKCDTEGGRSKTDKECFRCGRVCHIRADCRTKTHVNGRPPKSTLMGKGVGNCEEEEQQSSQNVPLGIIDLGSFEVLSDHGETKEDDVVVDESSEENAIVAISFLAQGNVVR